MTSSTGVFQSLDTVLIRVRDIASSKAWYQEKLGLAEPYFDPVERLVVFDLGGTTSLTLWELKENEAVSRQATPLVFPIFSVVDARRTREQLREREVEVGEIVESGGVTYFTFRDPDENMLEACQVH